MFYHHYTVMIIILCYITLIIIWGDINVASYHENVTIQKKFPKKTSSCIFLIMECICFEMLTCSWQFSLSSPIYKSFESFCISASHMHSCSVTTVTQQFTYSNISSCSALNWQIWISVNSTHTTLTWLLTPPGHRHTYTELVFHSYCTVYRASGVIVLQHENKTGHYGDQRNSAEE